MRFPCVLELDTPEVLRALGYGTAAPDDAAVRLLSLAGDVLRESAAPRWVRRRFALAENLELAGTGVHLAGAHIARHLAGCDGCILLAVGLGPAVEARLRTATAQDMAFAVVLDAAASTLAEQYAEAAEGLLREEAAGQGEFLTPRFSPGYGDLPLTLQADVLRLLDASRAMGLTVSESGILLPRKSITAILGVAAQPVAGALPGCESCALRAGCRQKEEGRPCGKTVD